MEKCNYALEKVVQNYFELHGSFDGISSEWYYNQILQGMAEHGNPTDTDELFWLLGYRATEHLKPAATRSLRLAFSKRDVVGIAGLLGKQATLQDAEEELTAANMLPIKVSDRPPRVSVNQKYVSLLSQYYATCIETTVLWNGALLPFPAVLEGFRLEGIKASKAARLIMESEALSQALVHFVFVDGIMPKVESGVFYVDRELTENERQQITKDALKEVIYPDIPIKDSILCSPTSLAIMASSDNPKYLALLDFTTIAGITYAQLLAKCGLTLPDYGKAYKLIGAIPVYIGDSILLITEQKYTKFTAAEFSERLSLFAANASCAQKVSPLNQF